MKETVDNEETLTYYEGRYYKNNLPWGKTHNIGDNVHRHLLYINVENVVRGSV